MLSFLRGRGLEAALRLAGYIINTVFAHFGLEAESAWNKGSSPGLLAGYIINTVFAHF